MKVSSIIKVGLVILLIASCGKLVYTLTEWYPHHAYLSDVENMMASELKQEIDIVSHHSKYLHSHINKDSLNIWYCEEHSCIDSLEKQLIRKNKRFVQYIEDHHKYWRTDDFSRWDRLKYLFRMESYLHGYYNAAWSWDCGLVTPTNAKIYNYLTDSIQVVQAELDYIMDNNLISINSGPFQRHTELWFKSPYQDTLRLTYFKDNYSYAMGGDSILKEYVLDVSHLNKK